MINWKVIALLGLALLFFMSYLVPSHEAELNRIVGSKVQILDVRPPYNKADVMSLFETAGEAGRQKMKSISSGVDVVYPLVYGSFFFLLLTKLSENFTKRGIRTLRFIPILAALLDYIENFSIVTMINAFPQISEQQVQISSIVTSCKWILVLASIIFVLVFLVLRRLQKDKSKT